MASSDQLNLFHENIAIFTGVGSVVSLLGLSSAFLSREYKEYDRVPVAGTSSRMERSYRKRQKTGRAILVVSTMAYIAGLALVTLGVTLYPLERDELETTVQGLILQNRTKNTQPAVHEPAVLSCISSALILAGVVEGGRHFHRYDEFGWIGSTLYAGGWLGQAFAGAMNDKNITSLRPTRLAWTLPGTFAIVLGTFLVPWQLKYNYSSGPAWPLAAAGYAAFSIGTSYVNKAQ